MPAGESGRLNFRIQFSTFIYVSIIFSITNKSSYIQKQDRRFADVRIFID